MNIRVIYVLCMACLCLMTRPSFGADDEFGQAIRSALHNHVDLDKKSVGIVVGLVDEHGSRIISYGRSDNPASPELNGDTLFEIGSITKVFTTLLLQDMVDRGEMRLDDPVAEYLPKSVKIPTRNGKQITLLQLATHSSGLPRDANNSTHKDDIYSDYTVEQLYGFLSGYTLTRDPGEKWEYSNLGMGLLGHVIALKADKDYETLVLDRICRTLKMDSTRINLMPELNARLAQGHTAEGAPGKNMTFQTLLGNGSLRSSANDMLKFLSAFASLTPSALSSSMRKTQTIHIENQALGWSRDDSWNFWKNGGTYAYRCEAGFNPTQHRAVIVLSNSVGTADEIDELAVSIMAGEWDSDKRPKPMKIDPSLLDASVGNYRLEDGSILKISRQGDRLLNQRQGHLTGELLPKSDSTFFGAVSRRELIFVRDAQGTTKQILLPANGKFVVVPKVDP